MTTTDHLSSFMTTGAAEEATTDSLSEPKRRVITLTDRAPVRIVEVEWPVIAKARATDNPRIQSQANRRWWLTVRAHADGRAIVYGVFDSCYPGEADRAGGELVAADDNVATAIRRVGEHVRCSEVLIDECIADLPAENL
jgi:hypothetical protein